MSWLEKHWLWIVALVVVYFLFKGAKENVNTAATPKNVYTGD